MTAVKVPRVRASWQAVAWSTAVGLALALAIAGIAPWRRWSGASRADWIAGFISHAVEGHIDEDGVIDFVVLCEDLAEDEIRLCGVDGATSTVRWRAEVMSHAEKTAIAAFDVVGSHVVALDPRGRMSVYRLSDGALESRRYMGDTVSAGPFPLVCAPPDRPGLVWLHQLGARFGALVDVPAGRAESAPLPASCAAKLCPSDNGHLTEECEQLARIDPHDERHVRKVLSDGRTTVQINLEPEGLIVFGSSRGEGSLARVLWRKALQAREADQLMVNRLAGARMGGGRVVMSYRPGGGEEHLLALDAATGVVLWEMPHPQAGFWLSTSRLYVSNGSHFDVRDAADGRLLGRLSPAIR